MSIVHALACPICDLYVCSIKIYDTTIFCIFLLWYAWTVYDNRWNFYACTISTVYGQFIGCDHFWLVTWYVTVHTIFLGFQMLYLSQSIYVFLSMTCPWFTMSYLRLTWFCFARYVSTISCIHFKHGIHMDHLCHPMNFSCMYCL